MNHSESFFEYIYQTQFSERTWFSKCSYEKMVKKESQNLLFIKVMRTVLDNKSNNFKFLTSFSLDIRPLSTEKQTNIALFLYSDV